MALFGGSPNVDRSPGTQLGRRTIADAQRATRRTAPISVPGFNEFQNRAFGLIGQQGLDPSVAAAQGFFPGLAGGQFVGQGPGQGALQQFAGGGFQNVALPAAQSALDFSQGITGIPPGLLGTAQGGNLASPFLSGEFNRITDPIAEQLRNVVLPSVAGTFAGSGRLGSGSFQAAENRALDAGERAISGVAADLLGRERGFQQQAQLSIPGILQQQLGGQLGAVGQLGGLSASDLQRQLGAAGTLESNFGNQLGLAGQFGLAAPGFAQGALGSQVNPLLAAGGQQQQLAQQQARARDDAIQREVERAALLAGRAPAFQQAPQGGSGLGGLGSLAGGGLGLALGGPVGAGVGLGLGGAFGGLF